MTPIMCDGQAGEEDIRNMTGPAEPAGMPGDPAWLPFDSAVRARIEERISAAYDRGYNDSRRASMTGNTRGPAKGYEGRARTSEIVGQLYDDLRRILAQGADNAVAPLPADVDTPLHRAAAALRWIENTAVVSEMSGIAERAKSALGDLAGLAPVSPADAEERALTLARSLWGYFKGGGAGGSEASAWFDGNLSLPGPAHVVGMCRSALAAPACIPAVPEGWQLVPKDPQVEMIGAWYRYKNGHRFHGDPVPDDTSCYGAYRAMLAAAPIPPMPEPLYQARGAQADGLRDCCGGHRVTSAENAGTAGGSDPLDLFEELAASMEKAEDPVEGGPFCDGWSPVENRERFAAMTRDFAREKEVDNWVRVSLAEAVRWRDRHGDPTGTPYRQGAWDMAQRFIGRSVRPSPAEAGT